jgi:hypothetical protein
MKRIIISLSLLALAATATAQKSELPQRKAFSNLGISLNAGLTGAGATLSTPLGKYFTARAGFGTLPYTHLYSYNNMPEVPDRNENPVQLPDVKLKIKLNVPAAHLLVDYSPFKQGWGGFHLTAGLYAGGPKLLHVNGSIDLAELDRLNIDYQSVKDEIKLEIGNAIVRPADNGTLDAYAEVASIRPYFGLGWGNAIPKNRVGFRFDIGAMYHGKPELTSPTMVGSIGGGEDVSDINRILGYAKFWPQIQLSLTVRLFKNK